MVDPAIRRQILNDLGQLSPEQQRHALQLVHGLVEPLPKGASVDDLLAIAGTLDDDSAREMIEAIEEEFERVEPHAW
jgi:hypothetical protein